MVDDDEEEVLDYNTIWNDGMEEELEEIERSELIKKRRDKYSNIQSISEICDFLWFILKITRLLGKGSEIDEETGERMELLTVRGYYKIRSKLEKARHIGDKNKAITRPESENFAKKRMKPHLLVFGIENELRKQSFIDIFYSLLDIDIEKYSFDAAAYSWALFTSICQCDLKENIPHFKAWNRIYPPSTTQTEIDMIKNNTESVEIRKRIRQAIIYTESAEEDEYVGLYKQIVHSQPTLETEQRRAERRGGGGISESEANVLNSIAYSQGHINSNEYILQKIVINDVDVDTDSDSDSDISDDSGFDDEELQWLADHGEAELSSDLKELEEKKKNAKNKNEIKSYLKLTRAWKAYLAAAQIDIEATEAEERRERKKKKGKNKTKNADEKKIFWVSLKSDYSMGFGEVTRPPRLIDYTKKAKVRRESRVNFKNKLLSDEQQKILQEKFQEKLSLKVQEEEEGEAFDVGTGVDTTAITTEEVVNIDETAAVIATTTTTSPEVTINSDISKGGDSNTSDTCQVIMTSHSAPIIGTTTDAVASTIDTIESGSNTCALTETGTERKTDTTGTDTTDSNAIDVNSVAAGSGSSAVKVISAQDQINSLLKRRRGVAA